MKKIFFLITLLVSSQAQAGYKGIKYEGAAYYHGYSKQFESDKFKPIIQKAENIMAIENSLGYKLKEQIQTMIAGKLSLKSHNFELDGPITFRLDGLDNGNIQIKVGGFTINSVTRLEKSWYADAKVSISSNTIWFTGKYDPYTGVISNLDLDQSVVISTSVDVDSILDLIPGFNAFVTNGFEDDLENDARSTIYSALNNTLGGDQNTLFGLNTHIPFGVYYYNGVDLGQQAVDSVRSLFSGESVEVTLTDSLISGNHWNSIFITFSDSLRLVIKEVPKTITPECTTPRCEIER